MLLLEPVRSLCPCCGEAITLLVDYSIANQEYVEDCEVCCRPLVVAVAGMDGEVPIVEVSPESS